MPEEYISRETALMKLMQDGCSAKNLQSISDMPAADVAEVVRCRDCKHRTEYGNCGHPRQKGVLPSAYPFDFCSYGDRRVDHLALEAETTQIIDG